MDRRREQIYTRSNMIAYANEQVTAAIDSIREKSNIPEEISVNDYAIYVRVHNAYVMAGRVAKAQQEYNSKKEVAKILSDTVNKKVKN